LLPVNAVFAQVGGCTAIDYSGVIGNHHIRYRSGRGYCQWRCACGDIRSESCRRFSASRYLIATRIPNKPKHGTKCSWWNVGQLRIAEAPDVIKASTMTEWSLSLRRRRP